MTIQVFVYGTLKPGEINYQLLCQDVVLANHRAIARGHLYYLPPLGYPGMTKANGWVEGALLVFPDESIFERLDPLEDYQAGREATANEYNRQIIDIFHPDQTPFTQAWAYFMSPAKIKFYQGIFLPAGIWHSVDFSGDRPLHS